MSIFNYYIDIEDKNEIENVHDRLSQAYTELEAVTNSIPGGVAKAVINNESITIKYASDGFYGLSGYTKDEYINLINNKIITIILEEDIPKLIKDIKAQLESDIEKIVEFRIYKKDGSLAWIMAQGKVIDKNFGTYTAMCIFTDITYLKKVQRQFEIEEERYRIVAEIADDYLFEYDNETDTMIYSDKYVEHFGISCIAADYMNTTQKRNFIYEEDWHIFLDIYEALRKGKKKFIANYRIKELDETIKWYSICFTTIFNEKNLPIKSIGKITDIDEQKKENDRLREKAQRDSLTKLTNNHTARKLIKQYIEKDSDSIHALMMIDIDNFKSVNDNYGHMAGDYVLSEFAQSLKKLFRSTDVVGRFGGDEFLVMLRGIQSDSLIDEKAKAICNIFHSIKITDDCEERVTGSVGIAIFPNDGTVFEDLLQKADNAVYDAKSKGKNRYSKYSEK